MATRRTKRERCRLLSRASRGNWARTPRTHVHPWTFTPKMPTRSTTSKSDAATSVPSHTRWSSGVDNSVSSNLLSPSEYDSCARFTTDWLTPFRCAKNSAVFQAWQNEMLVVDSTALIPEEIQAFVDQSCELVLPSASMTVSICTSTLRCPFII